MRRHLRNLILSVLCWCCTNDVCLAQPSSLSFTPYTTNDGLSGNEVVKTVTDHKGFLWVATHNGISRFDGKYFRKYSYIPGDTTSLRSIWATDLAVDKKGTLWATTEWGICWYDAIYDRFRYINPVKKGIVLYKAPLYVSNAGVLWIAAEDGLFYINEPEKKMVLTPLNKILDPQTMTEDNRGNLLIGTRGNGLFKYNIASGQYTLLNYQGMDADNHYMQAITDGAMCWVAGGQGLLGIEGNVVSLYNKFEGTDVNQLTAVCIFDQNHLLCGSNDGRLLLFDKRNKKFVYEWTGKGFPRFSLVHSIQKMADLFWIGTQTGLVKMGSKAYEYEWEQVKVMDGADKPFVQVLPYNNATDTVWLLANEGGPSLYLYDRLHSKILSRAHAKTQLPFSNDNCGTVTHPGGNLYAFAGNYINIFDERGRWLKEINFRGKVKSACFWDEKKLWAGLEDGLAEYDTESGNVTYYPLKFSGTQFENNSWPGAFPVLGLARGSENTLWVTCIKYGLFAFNIRTHTLTAYRQPSDKIYETLNRCQDVIAGKDTIWVSNMAGLSAYLPDKNKFINYNLKDGLLSNYVYDISMSENGTIWGRGNAGIFSFVNNRFTNYKLPPEFHTSYYLQHVNTFNNNCLLGLQNGMLVFNDSLLKRFPAPSVIINAIYANGREVESNRTVFAPEENNLVFDFSAVNFFGSKEEAYYRLDGLNNIWHPSFSSQILFAHLPPGNYTLHIKTKNEATGLWNPNEAAHSFSIGTPFYKKPWFLAVCILSALALSYYIYWQKIQKLAAVECTRQRISKDLHDDIGNTLSSITLMNAVLKNKINDNPKEASEMAGRIENISRDMIGTMSDIVWSINPVNDTFEQLLSRLQQFATSALEEKGTAFDLQVGSGLATGNISMAQKKDVYLICKEIINNAAKYSGATKLSLQIGREGRFLKIHAVDNGKGFELQAARPGNGLNNIRQRAQAYKGMAEIYTSPESGTEWKILIPMV